MSLRVDPDNKQSTKYFRLWGDLFLYEFLLKMIFRLAKETTEILIKIIGNHVMRGCKIRCGL